MIAADNRAKAQAEQVERDRIAKEDKLAREAKAREDDDKNRGKVHRDIKKALTDGGIPSDVAKKVTQALAKGLIPHVSINY